MSDNRNIEKLLQWARRHAGETAADRAFEHAPLPEIARFTKNRLEKPHLSGGAIWVWLLKNPLATRSELKKKFPKEKDTQLDAEFSAYNAVMKRIPEDLLPAITEFEYRGSNVQAKREISDAKISPKAETEANADTVIQDLSSVMSDTEIGETEKPSLLKARIGQGLFREKVIKICGGKCVVTGYDDASFLIASHIKPWRESDNIERLDGHNGLLLTPNLDKAFDKGLISFEDDGRILIRPDFERQVEKLRISSDMTASLRPDHKRYLELHRHKHFLNK